MPVLKGRRLVDDTSASFDGRRLVHLSASGSRDQWFTWVQLRGKPEFKASASFARRPSGVNSASFKGTAWFTSASFAGTAWFTSASFEGVAFYGLTCGSTLRGLNQGLEFLDSASFQGYATA